jgi:hypothetical protein
VAVGRAPSFRVIEVDKHVIRKVVAKAKVASNGNNNNDDGSINPVCCRQLWGRVVKVADPSPPSPVSAAATAVATVGDGDGDPSKNLPSSQIPPSLVGGNNEGLATDEVVSSIAKEDPGAAAALGGRHIRG